MPRLERLLVLGLATTGGVCALRAAARGAARRVGAPVLRDHDGASSSAGSAARSRLDRLRARPTRRRSTIELVRTLIATFR